MSEANSRVVMLRSEMLVIMVLLRDSCKSSLFRENNSMHLKRNNYNAVIFISKLYGSFK